MKKYYYIDFDTNSFNMLKALRVELSSEVILDKDKVMSINLCDDPLYPKLVRYVLNNPIKQ